MANNENLKKGKRFSSTRQPEKNGRRPNIIKKAIRENGLSKDDVKYIFLNLLTEKTGKLKTRKTKSDKLAAFENIGISSIMKDIENGDMKNINTMLEWCFGKPSQRIDATVTSISSEEREALKRALECGDD
jgi:hypothetical protein